jgi:hypothetical protein
MRLHQGAHKLTSQRRRRRGRDEVQETIQAEDGKYQAQQKKRAMVETIFI